MSVPMTSYSDLAELNTCRDLMDTVGKEVLARIAQDFLSLLQTSAAAYEVNGDYATALFTSDYCRFLDRASQALCGDCTNREALDSGQWHCHESCWTEASRIAVETGRPFDLRPCRGGINIYAVPIVAEGRVIGSINFGYGTPPTDEKTLRQIAERYQVDPRALRRVAEAYQPRSESVIEAARRQLHTAAELIAEIYLRRKASDALQRHMAELELMHRVHEALSSGVPLEEVLQLVAEGARSLFASETATVYFLDDDRRHLLMQKWTLPEKLTRQLDKLTGLNVREVSLPLVEGGHYWRVIKERRALLLDRPEEIEALIAELAAGHPTIRKLVPAIARLLGYCTVLIAPLVAGDEVVGVMDLGSRERLDEEDRRRFQLLAAQIGLAIERAKAEERERRQAARLALVNEIGRRASATLDLETLLQEAVEAVRDRVDYCGVLISLVDHQTGELVRTACARSCERKDPPARKPIDPEKGVLDWVALHGETLLANDVTQEPRYVPLFPETRSELCVPIKRGNQVLGVLNIECVRLNAFDQADVVAMETLADQLATAIENARLYAQAREHATQLEQANRQLLVLQEVTAALTSPLNLDEVLREIEKGALLIPGILGVLTFVVNEADNALEPRPLTTPFGDRLQRVAGMAGIRAEELKLPLIVGKRRLTDVALTGKPYLMRDLSEVAKTSLGGSLLDALKRLFPLKSLLMLPLLTRGKAVGVMVLGRSTERAIADEEMRSLTFFASAAGLAIERTRLFQEIQASRDYFRVVVNGLHDQVLIIVDRDYRISDANATFLRQMGYTREEVIGRPCYKVTHQRDEPCDGAEHPCPAQRVWESGEPARTVHVHYDREGKETYIDVAASPLQDAAGRVTGVIEAYRDVTAEHQLEEKLAAVHALGRELVLFRDEDQIAQAAVDVAERVLEFQVCSLWLTDGKQKRLVCAAHLAGEPAVDIPPLLLEGERGITVAVARSGEPIYLPDVRQDPRYIDAGIGSRSELCVPLKVGEKVIGILNVESEELDAFDQADMQLLSTLADQTAMAIENARLFESVRQQREQLRALAARLAEAEEAERQRLARELHDQVGQNLTALGINLNIVRAQMSEELADVARSRLDDSLALVEQTTERIRSVMADLRPPVLDDYGLVATLHWYGTQFASRTGIAVTVLGEEPVPRLALPVENAMFRIAQEALTNVARHAQATQVTVTAAVNDEAVRLIVADDGIGFDPARLAALDERRGWGLITMTERAEAVGGHLRVESAPGEGTRITVEVPR